jgi:hypothetical protein
MTTTKIVIAFKEYTLFEMLLMPIIKIMLINNEYL